MKIWNEYINLVLAKQAQLLKQIDMRRAIGVLMWGGRYRQSFWAGWYGWIRVRYEPVGSKAKWADRLYKQVNTRDSDKYVQGKEAEQPWGASVRLSSHKVLIDIFISIAFWLLLSRSWREAPKMKGAATPVAAGRDRGPECDDKKGRQPACSRGYANAGTAAS